MKGKKAEGDKMANGSSTPEPDPTFIFNQEVDFSS